jgi:hypothetical protein
MARRAAGLSYERGNGSLETKIEVVRVQLAALDAKLDAWRAEVKESAVVLRRDLDVAKVDCVAQATSHAQLDDAHHAAVIERLEVLEKAQVASDAVDVYKKWLISAVVLGGAGLLLNALRFLDQIPQIGRIIVP